MAEKEDAAPNSSECEDKAVVSAESSADPELDELLDSALQDFDKPQAALSKSKSLSDRSSDSVGGEAAKILQNAMGAGAPDAEWTEDFIKQATSQFEQNMRSLISQQGAAGNAEANKVQELGESFKKLAEVAARAVVDDTTTDADFSTTISQTLKNLSESAETLQAPMNEDELMNMFSGMGFGLGMEGSPDGLPEGGDIQNFMTQMMQSLLSKDILYPALKDIVDKYPVWLEEKKSSLEESDYERYSKQYELMKKVCTELEVETASDTHEVKKQRFDKVLDLMQKMQDYGHPPADLVGEVSLDEHGNPRIPGLPPLTADPSQCAIM